MHCVGGGGREEAIGTADGCRLYGGGCRLYEGAALRVGHDRGAVRVRDFRRATMGSVEEFYENEKNETATQGADTGLGRPWACRGASGGSGPRGN